jgi:hypothetical protein
VPRLWTRPLRSGPPGPCGCGCALTPDTSVGFDQVDFAAEVMGRPFRPWQRWVVIHAGELDAFGRLRFRIVHVQVARQNGKTEIPAILSVFWQVVDELGELDAHVLGTSTKIEYAYESLKKAIRYAERAPGLAGLVPSHVTVGPGREKRRREWLRKTNGEQESELAGTRYKISAANEEGGRSLTIGRLVLDELRQHHDYSAWDASVPATNAANGILPQGAQVWTLSNAGTDRSVVLNDERAAALAFLESGEGSSKTAWFEYSAPEDAEPTDPVALGMANPELERSILLDDLLDQAHKAVKTGGEKLAGFITEVMCRRVHMMDPAIDAAAWTACGPTPARPARALDAWRSRLALCVDVSPDGLHATVYAAAVGDDRLVHLDVVRAWSGPAATAGLRKELPALVRKVRPRAVGWFPSGPAAAVAAQLAEQDPPLRGWPPPGTTVEAIRGDVTAVCMGFAEMVRAQELRHPGDPLLSTQVASAEKLKQGDAWRFARGDLAYVDAVYAAAGAAHLARTLPAGPGRPRVLVPR